MIGYEGKKQNGKISFYTPENESTLISMRKLPTFSWKVTYFL